MIFVSHILGTVWIAVKNILDVYVLGSHEVNIVRVPDAQEAVPTYSCLSMQPLSR